MKFWEVFRFEVAYQARRPWTWIVFVSLGVFGLIGTWSNFGAEALRDDFYLNSPFVIAAITVIGGMLWLLLGAMTAGDAAARDADTGMHPLMFTAPISKAEYLGGRFLAAFVLNALILVAVPAGLLLAVYTGEVEAGVIGPFRPAAFLTAYGFIALPNAFVATAIQFSFAAAGGRPRAAYLGSVLLFFTTYVVGIMVGMLFGRPELAKLTDAVGLFSVVVEAAQGWTPAEKKVRLISLEGALLANRLLWLGIAAAALAVTHLRFHFAHRSPSPRGRGGQGVRTAPAIAGTPVAVPAVRQAFGLRTDIRQTLAFAWASFRAIATSKGGLALAAIPLFVFLALPDEMQLGNVQLLPTTAAVINVLTGSALVPGMPRVVPLFILLYAGELIWREREAGLGEIVGAAPVPDWVPFLGKFLGLSLVLVLFQAMLMGVGIARQATMGYHDFQVGLYLQTFFALQLPEYLLLSVLMLWVQVVVSQKYVGHVAAVLVFVVIGLAHGLLGIEHNLLVYGFAPRWSYTEMRGFGPTLGPWAWFTVYWAAWALLLAVAGALLWVRGTDTAARARLRLVRQRLRGGLAWAAGVAVALIIAVGGFIFYNTNVLHEYVSASERTERAVEYERRFRRYETVPQPRLAVASLRVEIYPERRQAEVRGTYTLVNRAVVAIDSLHLAVFPGGRTSEITLDRRAAAAVADDALGHHVYALEQPLRPGDTLRLSFVVRYGGRGFANDGADMSVLANGTYFQDDRLPAVGYQRMREITGASDRRKYGLGPRPLIIPSLYDDVARTDTSWSERSVFEAVVGTSEGQTAIAPGELKRTWTEGGRRYFHYVTDKPTGREWKFFSAVYAVREARWGNVPIVIYHHPAHTLNLDRMVRAAQATLDYHAEHYSPYGDRRFIMVEHPGTGGSLHAGSPINVDYYERFSDFNPRPRDPDLPFAVVGHEVAHHWWPGQLNPAAVEGAPLLSEGLAWYGSMRTVEAVRGRAELERLRRFMRLPYPIPPIRRGKPLLEADDPYAAYRKGPFAMWALSEYIGKDRVNTALRRLIERSNAPGAPLTTTLDLYRELRAVTPDSLRPLLGDLFERNTYWDLRTDRVTAEQIEGGAWRVTLEVAARKLVTDSAGAQTEVPMDAWVEIGVIARSPGESGPPLYLERHRIRSGAQTITVTVPRKPDMAGIDPYHVLDWEEGEDDDNVEQVKPGAPPSGARAKTSTRGTGS